MDFDAKMVFSFMNNTNSNNGYEVNSFLEELKKSYESQIASQAEIIGQLELEIAVLKGKVKKLNFLTTFFNLKN
ncbi:MAG: hypothetical protein EAZ27_01020 [Cytophagales bacterium]|nr:MAG: hypothetical protein EAZ27_01020 [Cytophagales bacterium]